MPAIVAHHLFGTELYAELAPTIGEGEAARNAFLLGNIGPDPYFCLRVLPHAVPYRELGATMHAKRPAKLLAAVHEHLIAADVGSQNPAARAFALGFLCHYLLDSTVHPLVYAQQHALCDAGVEGLTRERGGPETHALIETEYDEYLLTTHLGVTVSEFVPHEETLRCALPDLVSISAKLALVARDAYGLPVTPTAYASSVQINRAAQVVLDSKRDGLRARIDYARLTNRRYLHVLMMTHANAPRHDTPFANNDHFPWPHPFEQGSVMDASFDELYRTAYATALKALPRYARDDFAEADCETLARGLNFRGQRAEDRERREEKTCQPASAGVDCDLTPTSFAR